MDKFSFVGTNKIFETCHKQYDQDDDGTNYLIKMNVIISSISLFLFIYSI